MSQNSLVLPTTGTLSGISLVEGVNNALDTLNTLASAAAAPSSPEAGQLWHDTANRQLKLRSMDNTAWIVIGGLDETNYLFNPMLGSFASFLAALSSQITFTQSGGNWALQIALASATFMIQGTITGTVGAGSTSSAAFPNSFETACLNVLVTPFASLASVPITGQASNFTKTSCTFTNASSTSSQFQLVAFGY